MKLSLVNKKPEVPGVYTFVFEASEPITWLPGQYMHYVMDLPNADDRGLERWFTISSAPFEHTIDITTRFDGELKSSFKQALLALPQNGQIESDGPKGEFVLQDPSAHYVFIAGGIGITPFRSILAQAGHDGQKLKVDLLYANRDENFVFDNELESLAQANPEFHIKKFVGDNHIQETDLQPFIDDPTTVFYVSGPKPMVESYYEMLLAKVGEARVKKDFFPGY